MLGCDQQNRKKTSSYVNILVLMYFYKIIWKSGSARATLENMRQSHHRVNCEQSLCVYSAVLGNLPTH
jgi:hypothetical protein